MFDLPHNADMHVSPTPLCGHACLYLFLLHNGVVGIFIHHHVVLSLDKLFVVAGELVVAPGYNAYFHNFQAPPNEEDFL